MRAILFTVLPALLGCVDTLGVSLMRKLSTAQTSNRPQVFEEPEPSGVLRPSLIDTQFRGPK